MGTWILTIFYDLQRRYFDIYRYFMIWFIVGFYFAVVPLNFSEKKPAATISSTRPELRFY